MDKIHIFLGSEYFRDFYQKRVDRVIEIEWRY